MRDLYVATMLSDAALRSRAITNMEQEHWALIEEIGERIGLVVDVSGYGLGGALREIAVGLGAEITVPLSDLRTFWHEGEHYPECLASDVGSVISDNSLEPIDRLRLSTREFCGPMIFAVAHDDVGEISKIAQRVEFTDLTLIASYQQGRPDVTFI